MTASTLMSKSKKALADLVIAKEEELVKVTKQNSDVINEVTNLRKQYTEVTNKYNTVLANKEELVKQIKSLEATLATYKNSNTTLDADLQAATSQCNSIKEKYEQVLADSVTTKNKIRELTNEIQQANETINRKDGRINELTTSLKQASEQRDKFETLNNEYQKEIDDMTETNAILTKKANDFKLATISLAILVVISIMFVFII